MKASIRKINIIKRNDLSPEFIKEAGEGILNAFLNSGLQKKKSFMAYYPINNEAPIIPLLKRLLTDGKELSLPSVNKNDKIDPICFSDFINVTLGKYNIPEPSEGKNVNPDDIEVVLVPGVAFDNLGVRMGYGKGYYDRFLAESDFIKIGACYEFQISDIPLPTESHDIKMDYLLTEKKLYEV